MRLILDVGSGRSTHNDVDYVDAIVGAIKAMDTGKHEIILKAQLFKEQPPNVPLDQLVFNHLYMAGAEAGYKVTASVFDMESLKFLLNFDVPFIKIACRPDLYWLIGETPRKISLYVSYGGETVNGKYSDITWMYCVAKYPADEREYPEGVSIISDHTVGWNVFKANRIKILEKHFVLEREADNPDSGSFAVTPDELKEIL